MKFVLLKYVKYLVCKCIFFFFFSYCIRYTKYLHTHNIYTANILRDTRRVDINTITTLISIRTKKYQIRVRICTASATGPGNSLLDEWDSNNSFSPVLFVFLTVHMRERRLFKWYAILKNFHMQWQLPHRTITQQNLSSNAEPKPPKIGGVTKS